MNPQLKHQLSLFGLKPTAEMKKVPDRQLMIELREISEYPKNMMIEGKE